MSSSSTLTLSPMASSASKMNFTPASVAPPPASMLYQNSSFQNNYTSGSLSYYNFPSSRDLEHSSLLRSLDISNAYAAPSSPAELPTEQTLLLERDVAAVMKINAKLHKSNSYSGSSNLMRPKATVLMQDITNGRIATSLTADENRPEMTVGLSGVGGGGGKPATITAIPKLLSSAIMPNALGNAMTTVSGLRGGGSGGGSGSSNDASSMMMANEDAQEEYDAFLVSGNGSNDDSGIIDLGEQSSSSNNNNNNNNNNRRNSKTRNNVCLRVHALLTHNYYISYLVPLSILLALMFVAYLTRDYAKQLLYWIETQNPWVTFGIFMALFVVVSFPVVVGYFVLKITVGYLFGFLKGFPTVILGANVGIAIAHLTIRSLRHRIPMHKIIKNETGRAILRVIAGPRAFKVVLFTRLTPIPFGLQNAIFGVSSINPRIYHLATFIGLLPAQAINVYLGSTLRSMHEVLHSHGGTSVTGYITFGVEVICGVALMFWVVQKARKELSDTLLSDIGNDRKFNDIQV